MVLPAVAMKGVNEQATLLVITTNDAIPKVKADDADLLNAFVMVTILQVQGYQIDNKILTANACMYCDLSKKVCYCSVVVVEISKHEEWK
jgi:phage-related protein